MVNPFKKKVEEVIKVETVDAKSEPGAADKDAVLRDLFGGVYAAEQFGSNPTLLLVTVANLLYDVRAELRLLNAELKKE